MERESEKNEITKGRTKQRENENEIERESDNKITK